MNLSHPRCNLSTCINSPDSMPVPPASVNSSASATPFTISLTRLSSVEHLVCSWAILPSDATEICFHSLHFTPWMINDYAVSFPSFPLRLCIPFFLHPSERLWHVTVQQWNYAFFFFWGAPWGFSHLAWRYMCIWRSIGGEVRCGGGGRVENEGHRLRRKAQGEREI